MWDWAVVWPVMTVVMKYLSYAGIILVVVGLLVIPQIRYRMDKEGYFLLTEDYEAYKELKKKQANKNYRMFDETRKNNYTITKKE